MYCPDPHRPGDPMNCPGPGRCIVPVSQGIVPMSRYASSRWPDVLVRVHMQMCTHCWVNYCWAACACHVIFGFGVYRCVKMYFPTSALSSRLVSTGAWKYASRRQHSAADCWCRDSMITSDIDCYKTSEHQTMCSLIVYIRFWNQYFEDIIGKAADFRYLLGNRNSRRQCRGKQTLQTDYMSSLLNYQFGG